MATTPTKEEVILVQFVQCLNGEDSACGNPMVDNVLKEQFQDETQVTTHGIDVTVSVVELFKHQIAKTNDELNELHIVLHNLKWFSGLLRQTGLQLVKYKDKDKDVWGLYLDPTIHAATPTVDPAPPVDPAAPPPEPTYKGFFTSTFDRSVSDPATDDKLSLMKKANEAGDHMIRSLFPMRLEHFKERYVDDEQSFSKLVEEVRAYEARIDQETQSLKNAITDLASIYSMTNDQDHQYINDDLNAILQNVDVPAKLTKEELPPAKKSTGGGRMQGGLAIAKKLDALFARPSYTPSTTTSTTYVPSFNNTYTMLLPHIIDQQLSSVLRSIDHDEKMKSLDTLLHTLQQSLVTNRKESAEMLAITIGNQIDWMLETLEKSDEVIASDDLKKITNILDVMTKVFDSTTKMMDPKSSSELFATIVDTQLSMMQQMLTQAEPVVVPPELPQLLDRVVKLFDMEYNQRFAKIESGLENVIKALEGKVGQTKLSEDQKLAVEILGALHSNLQTAILEILSQKEAVEKYDSLQNQLTSLESNNAANTAEVQEGATLVKRILAELKTALGLGDDADVDAISAKVTELQNAQDARINQAIERYIAAADQKVQDAIDQKKLELNKSIADLQSRTETALDAVKEVEAEKTKSHEVAMEQAKQLGDVVKNLTGLIDSVKKGGMEGGAPKDAVEQAKELKKAVDAIKGKVRDVEIVAQDLIQRSEKLDALVAEATSATDVAAVGVAKSFETEGKKVYTELQETIQTTRKQVEEIYKKLVAILEADPTNKKYMDKLAELRSNVEGDFNASDDDAKYGILAKLDKMKNIAKTDFDAALTNVKGKAAAAQQKATNEKNQSLVSAATNFFKRGGAIGADLTKIQSGLKTIREIVQMLDKDVTQRNNPIAMGAVGNEPSMFLNLYNQYLQNKSDKSPFQASSTLARSLEENKLLPREVLQVTTLDKTIFIFVTLFVRLFALSIIEFMIEKDKITKMVYALLGFLVMYTLILAAFVAFVNSDLYRMRIVFNYVNLHGSSAKVMTHVLILWLFSFLIFFIMWQVNPAMKEGESMTKINEEEKVNLIYRIQVLTMIVWLFLVLMIVMM